MEASAKTYNLENILSQAIDEGVKGFNIGIPFSIKKLNIPTGGIMKGIYYLILGASKSGKSSFFYDQFMFNMVDLIMAGYMKEEDVEIILYSLEIDRVMITAKAAVRYLLRTRKILTSTKRLLGVYGKTPIEIASIMKDEGFIKYLGILNRITHIFTTAKPMEMFNYIYNRCITISDKYGVDPNGKPLFHFKNKKKRIIVGIDHLALVTELPNSSLKKTMDLISKSIFVDLKRMFGITPVAIQQVNPKDNGDGQKKLIYGHADARDTKNTFQDCDICIALGSPYHEEISSVRFGNNLYHIKPNAENNDMGLLDRFRLFGIEKDRYGDSALRIAAAYLGEVGMFKDIEPPDQIDYNKYLFNEFKKI